MASTATADVTTLPPASPTGVTDAQLRAFIREVYMKTSPRNVFSMYVTGGGTTAIEWVFTVPGASQSLMDAGVVYARSSLEQFIQKYTPPKENISFCSTATSVMMADAAWTRAAELYLADTRNFHELATVNLFGVSCTAALVSDRPKKGPHRVHIASSSQARSHAYTVSFEKGARTRVQEDIACSRLILDAVAEFSGVPALPRDYLLVGGAEGDTPLAASTPLPDGGERARATEVVDMAIVEREDVVDCLLAKRIKQAIFVKKVDGDGNAVFSTTDRLTDDFVVLEDASLPAGCLVFPGSFNPLHEGHVGLVVAALQKLNGDAAAGAGDKNGGGNVNIPVVFEISAINADKPPLPREEVARRVRQFDPHTNPVLKAAGLTNIAVAITTEPLFLGKTSLFKNATFLIGSDTLARLINPKYYGPPAPTPAVAAGEVTTDEERRLYEQKVYATVSMLSIVAERGCRFVVGGRAASATAAAAEVDASATFDTMPAVLASASVPLPADLLGTLFVGLSEEEFRVDMSSTEIRERGNTPQR